MSSGQHSDDLAAKAAEAVRRVVAEAEDRAAEILREAEAKASSIHEQAEADASQIRERAEADARGQIEAAKRALDELGGTLVAAATEAIPGAESQPAEPEPPPEQVVPPEGNGDDAAARLVAMKLAVDGMDRAEIESELTAKFGASDRSALLDDVLARISR
jgi:hypothetical protein